MKNFTCNLAVNVINRLINTHFRILLCLSINNLFWFLFEGSIYVFCIFVRCVFIFYPSLQITDYFSHWGWWLSYFLKCKSFISQICVWFNMKNVTFNIANMILCYKGNIVLVRIVFILINMIFNLNFLNIY